MEPSSSITFASSSSYLSNGSSPCSLALPPPGPPQTPPLAAGEGWGGGGTAGGSGSNVEAVSLNRLSKNLERLLLPDSDLDCSDADVDVPDGEPPVPIHRCILAARSAFFYDLFAARSRAGATRGDAAAGAGGEGEGAGSGRPRYKMEELVPGGRVGREAFQAFLGYLYTGKLRPAPPDVVSCADPVCPHDSCPPAIRFAVELMYAAWTFKIPELVSLFQRRLLNFVDKTLVEDVIPILHVASHAELTQVLDKCIQRIARSDLDDISLDKELPPEVVDEIKKIRRKSKTADGDAFVSDPVHEKRVRRIHRALDSDDVELVKLLLNESEITLDDANALHYAASYCDSKVVSELLDLGLPNLNLKNSRGYTALHLAAMRREPAIIMCLLNKGAIVSQPTADGRSAISICRRLTRSKDYNTKMEQGQESNKDRLCIDILEREMMRNPMAVEDAVTSPLLADDLHMKLLYLENRVAFARLFFPAEAKVAMQIAQADTTEEFGGISAASTCGKLREVDLNETPVTQNKRLRSRVDALMKTVELGRRYFPNCSQVLDKFLEDDLPDGNTFFLQNGSPDEQKVKRMRFCELKEDVRKAFSKDKADSSMFSGLSSSSSCSPPQKVVKK
ncbi:BTB/POZ domain and ankyrin repeat-containing protein NPR2-like [Phragmites australis]|uniref:BTB/POZ domain and ankyrin repeat-containing protein NPR2-like n=1 Tax=Phragmites australis TaxID=29695 RepID=UPI002D77C257|nr:BTB/POZ domain and ankyrin repeat-containing protein NPR2-like [Phragmites australis]